MSTHPDLDDDDALGRALRASAELHTPPEAVLQRVIDLWQPTLAPRPALAPGRLRQLAQLVFESAGASPLAFGMRSSGGAVRQLLYSFEGRDIDLRIAPATDAGAYVLSGQVLGPDSTGTVLMVPANGGDEQAASLSELGEFKLAPVPGGTYHVTLDLGELAIDLPPVHIPLPA